MPMAAESRPNACVICCLDVTKTPENTQVTVLHNKGLSNLVASAEKRGDAIEVQLGQTVHKTCYRDYTNEHRIAAHNKSKHGSESPCKTRTLRSMEIFSFKNHCFFCGNPAHLEKNKTKNNDVMRCMEMEFKDKMIDKCKERNDTWSAQVYGRLEFVSDLPAADAIYHKQCLINFTTQRNKPLTTLEDGNRDAGRPAKRPKLFTGRPPNDQREEAFLRVAAFLVENDDEQVTILDLVHKMNEYLQDDGEASEVSAFSVKHMKRKIEEHFQDKILIAERGGVPDVVTFSDTASCILNDFFQREKKSKNADDVKNDLIRTAAKILKADMKKSDCNKQTYPQTSDISSTANNLAFLPDSLQLLLRELFVGKELDSKIAAIGQAIMQAVRPRIILAPLQIGLGVQMNHLYGSRFLVETLYSMGFACSYSEVLKYQSNAAMSQNVALKELNGQFVQFVADNVDHNTATLDGHNSFHGMGIIASITPGVKFERIVPRNKVTKEDLIAAGRINIRCWKSDPNWKSTMKYEHLDSTATKTEISDFELLWKFSWGLKPSLPAWSGFMQMVTHGRAHPGQSSVNFLPIIDMNPSDMSCVYSTLSYISDQAKAYNITPLLTFDQPLWMKATTIIEAENPSSDLKRIVLRLGAFHTQMSFLGTIGHIMMSSGLEDLLAVIYAPNSVMHMLSGKAVARATRGHQLVECALTSLLLDEAYPISDPQDTSNEEDVCQNGSAPELTQLSDLLERVQSGVIDFSDCEFPSTIISRLEAVQNGMKSRTARLWLQYMEMCHIVRLFIAAERTGNWALHLETSAAMLPYLAASGHNSYTKSLHLYIQTMKRLPEEHPAVYDQFCKGLHVVRRSDRFWAGLSTDLLIEQVLMRSLKTQGGLTRGRGLDETQRLRWLLGMPPSAEMHHAMQEATCNVFTTSEQHQDCGKARIKRDREDVKRLREYLLEKNPFLSDTSLRSIATGMTGDAETNADNAKQIGQDILRRMEGSRVVDHVFKKCNQIKTLASSKKTKSKCPVSNLPPQLLFQRFLLASEQMENRHEIFHHELSSHPPALFEDIGVMRKAIKPALADAIWQHVSPQDPVFPHNTSFVLDGGSLLYRLPWPKKVSYNEIVAMYVQYVLKTHHSESSDIYVIFDGYESGPSTKDATHDRRRHGVTSPEIRFVPGMTCTSKKEVFLSNDKNKVRFLELLGQKLKETGCHVIFSTGDADLDIIQTAISVSETSPATVIGEDTDLLILLLHHAPSPPRNEIYFRSEKMLSKKRVWNIHCVQQCLGKRICMDILFIHAFLGCDTTSGLYSIGKGSILKAMMKEGDKCESLRMAASTFMMNPVDKNSLFAVAEKAMVAMYGGHADEPVNNLRQRKFSQKVVSSTKFVHPQTLPPTSSAIEYHSLRVYHQIQAWRGYHLDPLTWGWRSEEEQLIPIMMSTEPAPAELLKTIRCNCLTECKTSRCSCRRAGLECTLACGECRGMSCANSHPVSFDDGDQDDQDDNTIQ